MPATQLSRYEFAPVETDDDGNVFLDVPDPIKKVVRADDLRTVVTEGDTLHTLAWRAYKALKDTEKDIRPTAFFDVIAQANDIVDAVEKLENGSRLRIPSAATVIGEIRTPPAFFSRSRVVT